MLRAVGALAPKPHPSAGRPTEKRSGIPFQAAAVCSKHGRAGCRKSESARTNYEHPNTLAFVKYDIKLC